MKKFVRLIPKTGSASMLSVFLKTSKERKMLQITTNKTNNFHN